MKVIIMTLIAMVVVTVVLIWIGNFELPDFSQNSGEGAELPTEYSTPNLNASGGITGEDVDLIDHDFYWENGGNLELPVEGATGWAATNLVLREEANASSGTVTNLTPGYAFTILEMSGDWWYVRLPNQTTGWVEIRRCFINIPDVIPSIVYNITNASSSVFHSSTYPLPGITGLQLYSAFSFNPRLGREEYIVPGMYSLALALFNVQQSALGNDETIIIYEVFRPRATQRAVASALNELLAENIVARLAIEESSYSVGNFISQGRSNHQLGGAVDASIGNISEREYVKTGIYSYQRITGYRLIHAHSAMHELSPMAARSGINTADAAQGIRNMHTYFSNAGFRPLNSEWWHYDHTASINSASSVGIDGDFFTENIYSEPPVR